MRPDSSFRQRFIDAPGLLAGRKQRRTLRRAVLWIVIALTTGIGLVNGLGNTVGGALITVGLAFAGLFVFGMAGLFLGVALTFLSIIVYNVILNGPISLVDLDYIDEVPLIFVAALGVGGVFIAMSWDETMGLVGWGLTALVLVDAAFRRPDKQTGQL